MADSCGWKSVWQRQIYSSQSSHIRTSVSVCELSGEGAAKGGFKGQDVGVLSVVDLRGRKWL